MRLTKKRSLLNAFFVSQFGYCPLTSMCFSRTLNNRINKDFFVLFMITKNQHLKNCLKGINLFHYTIKFAGPRNRNV